MKKNYLIILVFSFLVMALNAQVNIPDSNFKAALLAHGTTITGTGISTIDTDANGEISTAEAAAYTGTIKVDNQTITDLTGIEAFTATTQLSCNYNNLTTLDVSSCTALETLFCSDNESLATVTLNTALKHVVISGASITGLDVSQCTALEILECTRNENLTSLNVTNNNALKQIVCTNNYTLTSLVIGQKNALTNINCAYNSSLTTLDVNQCSALTELWCNSTAIPSLDVTNNPALETLSCEYSGSLTSLTIGQGVTSIKSISCGNTGITHLDVSNNPTLERLSCYESTDLISIDASNCTALTDMSSLWGNSSLTSLNVSGCTALQTLGCYRGKLTTLDVSDCTALRSLSCYENELTTLTFGANTALTNLTCHKNQLTSLDVSQCTALDYLSCYENQLTGLDVSNNTVLEELKCYKNQLTGLNLGVNTVLNKIYCYENSLTSLNVSNNTSLKGVNCHTNQLATLDVSQNTNLNWIVCNDNQLTSLNLANGNNGTSSTNLNYVTATNNANLTCIQHDSGFDPTTASNWTKDSTASWSSSCSVSALTYVPDDNFEQKLIDLGYDTTLDDYVTTANIASVTSLDIGSSSISDLTGIEDFTALTSLSCFSNQLINLNLTQNTALTSLNCSKNQLVGLNLTQNTNLETLYAGNNQLNSLDISQNTALKIIDFSYNQVTSLDPSQNTALEQLYSYGNRLTVLDVSNNTALTALDCGANNLTALDVSANGALTYVDCNNSSLLASLNLANGNNSSLLTTVIATNCPNVTCIQHDSGFTPTTNWSKDSTASWSDNCVASSPQFSITPTTKDFGNVEIGQTVTETFTITNNGTADLVISSFVISGTNASEFGHNGTAQTISPNNSYNVTVTFTPTSVGSKTASLSITNNAGSHTAALTGNATTVSSPQFSITPTTKDFGNVEIGQTVTETFTITNNGTADLVISSFAISGTNASEFSYNGTTQTISPNSSYNVTVTFAPTSVGSKTASLSITDNAGSHTVALTGNATVVSTPQFSITPTTKDFGNVEIGQTVTETFTITNNGTADLVISSFAISGTNASEFSHNGTTQTISPNSSYNVTVTFAPTSVGSKAASLSITDNVGSHTVALTGNATAVSTPQFSITPTTKDFGNVEIGQTVTETFTITNNGTADLVISSFAISGTNASEFSHNGTTQTISPNSSYNVTVTFAPTSVGSKAASLSITDNAGSHMVALTGNAMVNVPAPQYTITSTSKYFGDIHLGQTVTETFTITNTGTANLEISYIEIDGVNANQFGHTAINNISIVPNQSYEFLINFRPTSLGTKTSNVIIVSNAGNYNVHLYGKGIDPKFSVTPTQKDFGKVKLGDTLSETIIISNEGTSGLIIYGLRLTGSDTKDFNHTAVYGTLIKANESYEFTVSFTPTSIGKKEAYILIADNTGNHQIALQGVGIEKIDTTDPQFAIAPISKDFGDVEVDKTVTETFAVTNNGTANLVISSFALSGTNADEFGHTATVQTIASGDSYEFIVTFTPNSEGNKTANLDITDNAGNHISVTLTGNATAVSVPKFTITPVSKDFGDVEVGKTVTETFAVTNNGTADLVISSFVVNGTNASEFGHTATVQTIASGDSYEFIVTFTPNSKGNKTAKLDITDNAGDHFSITLTGNATAVSVPKFTITPVSKDFGDVEVGKTVIETFTITNNGTANLIISSFVVRGTNASDFSHNGTVQTIAPGDSYEFTVTFLPIGEGVKTASIIITDNTEGHNISLRGKAVKKTQELYWDIDDEVIEVGCDGETTVILQVMSSSNLPITYEVLDPSIATVEGNVVTFYSAGATQIKAIQNGNVMYQPAEPLVKTLEIKANDLVQQHWDNALFFDNSGGQYIQWQWYKDDVAIQGATKAYYANDNDLSGSYYVKATNSNGKQITTCPLVMISGENRGGISVYPNPVYAASSFTLKANYSQADLQDSQLIIASISGVVVSKSENILPESKLTAPTAPGIYIVSLQLSNGMRVSANLWVK